MGHFSRDCPEPPKQHNQSAALTHRGGSRPKTNHKPTSYRKPSYKSRVTVLTDEEDPEDFCFCTGIERCVKAKEWVVDSGATMHMTWDKGVFVTYAAMDDMPSVWLCDGRHVKAEGRGSVRLIVRDNKEPNVLLDYPVFCLCQTYPAICFLCEISQTRATGCCLMTSHAASSQRTTR